MRVARGWVGAPATKQLDAALLVGYLLYTSGELGVARPIRRIVGTAVERVPRVAAQIERLARVRHRPDPDVAIGEKRLDAADPGRPIGAQRGDRLVNVPVETLSDCCGELRLGLDDVLPAGQVGQPLALRR